METLRTALVQIVVSLVLIVVFLRLILVIVHALIGLFPALVVVALIVWVLRGMVKTLLN